MEERYCATYTEPVLSRYVYCK